MTKLGQMVLKCVNRVHYDKIRSNGLERSQLGTQCKHMCAFMHHIHTHVPPNTPKCKIYPVGLPSVLYETPGHNERSVLNQVFLLLFSEMQFDEKCNTFHEKRNTFQ